jgi:hypothetical protein
LKQKKTDKKLAKLEFILTAISPTCNSCFELAGFSGIIVRIKFSLSRKLRVYELPAISKQQTLSVILPKNRKIQNIK